MATSREKLFGLIPIALAASGFLLIPLCCHAQPDLSVPQSAAPTIQKSEPEVWLTFGLNRLPLLQFKPIAGIPLWQYVASLIYIFLAFSLSKALDALIAHRVKKWAAKNSSKLDVFVELLHWPVKIVVFVVLLHIGINVYTWPDVLENFISKGLIIFVAGSITCFALKVIDLLVGIWRDRTTTPENEPLSLQLLPLIRKSLKVFVVIVAVLLTSQNLGLNVTGLIASLSIGGLALGLAAQDTLANLFGAVAVLLDRPFRVGDRIQINGVDGSVESIGFRSTRVRNLDGHLVTVPNKTMGNATITNVSRRTNIKTVMNIGLTYDTSSDQVRRALQIIEEVYRGHPRTSDLMVGFNKFESSSLNILVVHWWSDTDFKAYLTGLQTMNLTLKERFDTEGIDFAFPTQTLHIKQNSHPQTQVP